MNIPTDFNYKIYKELNSDLKDLSEEELKKHYFSHGINENRPYKYILPGDFNYKIYKELNSDLNNFSEEELKKHYFFQGINENRPYKYILPDDFNYEIYRELNNDLKDFSEEELKKHYFYHGINENRPYKNILNNNNEYDENILLSLINKYSNKDNIINYNSTNYTDDSLLNILIKKLFNNYEYDYVLNYLFNNNFTKIEIINIIRNENYLKVKNLRLEIDNIILNFTNNKKLDENRFFKKITIKNINFDAKYYFGIIIPVYNRYYITKIFLECLKQNVNFDSIIFCIVDDCSNNDIINELESLNLNVIIVYCNRNKNIYGSHNTTVPGSMFPITLYVGHEILKNYCNILGVLDSDAFINENYFNECKSFIDILDMNNIIFSGFNSNSECHKIIDKKIINGKNILYKNIIGGISLFYSVKLYEEFKLKFTGEESDNYWAYDFDFQISNFMQNTNRFCICLEESNLQHIGIKTTMIRNNNEFNHNDKELIETVYKLLIDPNYRDEISIEFDFDKKFISNKENIDKIFNKLWIYTFIDKIYYINLEERTDRKVSIEEQLNKFNICNYERFSAIKPSYNKKYDYNFIDNEIDKLINGKNIVNDLFESYSTHYILDFSKEYIKQKSKEMRRKYLLGALGCKLSHLEILKKSENLDILMLEDDAILHDKFNEHIKLLYNNLKNINFNYDMIWLSPNWLCKNNNDILNRCYSYKYINENFASVDSSLYCDNNFGSSNNTAGNIFNRNAIKYIINNIQNNNSEIDVWYRNNIQSKGKTYTTIPNLITQQIGDSNIENYEVNYIKDIQYKTRAKYNIFTILNKDDKDLYLNNLKNNLHKMIGYEKIYYICGEELFNIEILNFININTLENDIELLKINFNNKVNDNNIKYFYYMDKNLYLTENFYPFDENNNLIIKDNFINS